MKGKPLSELLCVVIPPWTALDSVEGLAGALFREAIELQGYLLSGSFGPSCSLASVMRVPCDEELHQSSSYLLENEKK